MSEEEKSTTTSALQDNIERKGKNAYYFAHAHKANGPKWDGNVQPRLLARHSSSTGNTSTTTTSTGIDGNDAISNQDGTTITTTTSTTTTEMESQLANTTLTTTSIKTSFEYSKSNITKYAFVDEGPKIKIYIEFPDIGNCCTNQDIQLKWKESSFCLTVDNYLDPSLRDVTKNEGEEGGTEEKQDETMGETMGETKDTTTNTTTTSTIPITSTPTKVKKPETYCLSFGKLHGPISKATYKLKPNKIIILLTKKLKNTSKKENEEQVDTTCTTSETKVSETTKAANVENDVEENNVFSVSDDDDEEEEEEIETWPAIGAKGADL